MENKVSYYKVIDGLNFDAGLLNKLFNFVLAEVSIIVLPI